MALLADPHTTPSAPLASAYERHPLVLIVEDHDDTRLLLKTLLEMCGYLVAEAKDGEEGVRVACSAHPQLVIMDATLPRLDGLSATRRIRSDSSLKGVPVVFISGHAHPSFRAAALDAGGTDFLVKPISLTELVSVIERRLRADAS